MTSRPIDLELTKSSSKPGVLPRAAAQAGPALFEALSSRPTDLP
jgi:hypothetical protein